MIKIKQTFNIRETAEILVPDSFGRTSYLVALLLIVLMIGSIVILSSRLPNLVPLYFTLPWGEARLAPRVMLFVLPATSLLFLILNLGLSRISRKLSPLLPRILSVSAMIVTIMMLISLVGIVQSLIL